MTRKAHRLVLPFVAAVLCLLATARQGEVVYEGRPLQDWLDGGYEDASRALHEVGPAAVPVIFAKLRHEHPQYGYWQRYRAAWRMLPRVCQEVIPQPRTVSFDEWRACNALVAIGPRAIPALASGLRHPNWLVRLTSAQALVLFQQRGASIRTAIPQLESAARDRDPTVRRQAAQALAHACPERKLKLVDAAPGQ